ncbi:hypothetical protein TSUD_403900 [Trifolium subterraneum]|uniref:Uncharacterized protein n=1 Tax=Trifolium subterraneum TaxID=3900 RepID=A0A2Z6NT68_TRISU|nr:hypothetical protein TSUD_403900 [Trifolium subterraneum]
MKTVSDEEWMSYLAKSKAKKLQPDDPALPDDLLILGETKGSKRKRRGDRVRPSLMATNDVGSFLPAANVALGTEDVQMGEFVDGGVTVQTAGPPPAVVGIGSSVWGSLFDLTAFVENTLLGAGDSARFDSLTTSDLCNLALRYEVKGTVLTHLLSARRDKEIMEASSKVARAEQAVIDTERTITEIKKQWANKVDHLKKAHQEALIEVRGAHTYEMAGLRKKHADEKTVGTKCVLVHTHEF